ncbi:MAG: 4Fe-4S binding protein [Peptococcia bacterium]
MQLYVDKQRCPQNHRCPAIKVCPVNAISQEGYSLPTIDEDKCIVCKKCMKFCPMKAFRLNE